MTIEELKSKKLFLKDELREILRSFEKETGVKITSFALERYNGSIVSSLKGDGEIFIADISCEI